jgi:hypothetical protein
MKNYILILVCLLSLGQILFAQNESETEGFKKENFFVGGSISFAASGNTFGVGGNPEFGYSLTKWADVGIMANYNYTSYRQYNGGDRLHQTIYGGGFYTRLFPIKFLFAQVQIEHNWINEKELYSSGGSYKWNLSSNSFLVGAGYTTGKNPSGKSVYGYFSVLVDLLKEDNSPYVAYEYDPNTGINHKRMAPIIRAGFIVPLFQGHRGR